MAEGWRGADELRRRLRALQRPDVLAEIGGALVREAEGVIGASQPLVPVDTGTLRGTGGVDPPEIEPGKVSVVLGYGGPAASYAVPVHERLDVTHEVGEAKYLERPFHERRAGIEERVGQAVETAIRRRVPRRSARD